MDLSDIANPYFTGKEESRSEKQELSRRLVVNCFRKTWHGKIENFDYIFMYIHIDNIYIYEQENKFSYSSVGEVY